MLEKFKKISNPLTIIAVFAGLAEVSATVALSLVARDLQVQFIWFVMLFPVFLVSLFFLTLNFNSRVLYSPGDFSDEGNFMDLYRLKAAQDLTSIEASLAQDEARIQATLRDAQNKLEKAGIPSPDLSKEGVALFSRGNVAKQKDDVLSPEMLENLQAHALLWREARDKLKTRLD